jgi:hypothetical protein
MSYLSNPTTKTDYGVVLVGDYINVTDGIISLSQDLSPLADVDFNSVTAGNVTDSSLTEGRITFAGTSGLLVDDDDLTYDSTTNTLSVVNVSVSGILELDGDSVITSVTPTAGDGISITNLVSSGPDVTFDVNNTGVLSLTAGTGISISGSTGNITISSTGADLISVVGTTTNYTATATDEYIGVNSTSAVTITLPPGIVGRVYSIKDERGQGSGKITIQPNGTEKIDNAISYIISVPYQSVSIVFRAGGWWLI